MSLSTIYIHSQIVGCVKNMSNSTELNPDFVFLGLRRFSFHNDFPSYLSSSVAYKFKDHGYGLLQYYKCVFLKVIYSKYKQDKAPTE